jgi:hypothetical protein
LVAVVQLVEHQVVILEVAGSSPVSHPAGRRAFSPSDFLLSEGSRIGPADGHEVVIDGPG